MTNANVAKKEMKKKKKIAYAVGYNSLGDKLFRLLQIAADCLRLNPHPPDATRHFCGVGRCELAIKYHQ